MLVFRVGLMASALAIPLALADEFHNVNQIVGDRAIGMAGAYGAVSDDPSGMVYNPAGIAFSNSASMSANVNTLQSNSITYTDVLNGEYDYQRSSYQVLPNFFGVVQPFGRFKLGFYNAIVDSTQEKQDQSFEDFGSIDRFIVNLNNIKTSYNVGPAIATKLGKKMAVGFSVPLHYRSSEFISNQSVLFSDSVSQDLEWTNTYIKKVEQGVRPKLGIVVNPIEKLSFGLTVDQTYVLNSSQTLQEALCSTNDTDVGCAAQVNPTISSFSFVQKYPIQVRAAVAWFQSSALLLSGDFIYHSPVSATEGFVEKKATYDAALGLEWYWTSRWALRSGAFTAHANTPKLNNTDTFQSPHIDRYGATISVARFSQGSSISFGLLGQYGTGESQLFADLAGVLQETTSLDLTAFFTTSYRY